MDISRALLIRGWMGRRELEYLAKMAMTHERILEIGTFAGRSARAMADNCPGTVYCVDPLDPAAWPKRAQPSSQHERLMTTREEGDEIYIELQANMADLIVEGRVFLIREASRVAVPKLGRFDMAFIDGDHAYGSVKEDIALCLDRLVHGGILIGDDYWEKDVHQGVKQAVHEVFGDRVTRPCGKLWQVNVR